MASGFKHFIAHTVLPAVNRVLAPLSLKLIPASTPTRDFREFIVHAGQRGMKFGTVIDVGVGRGTPGLHDIDADYYLFEPDPRNRRHMERIADRLGGQAFAVAAGSIDGAAEFNAQPVPTGSSFYRQVEGEELDGERILVPVRRLDSMIPRTVKGPILLKIDTQGHELEVMKGASGILDLIDVVILETSFHEFRFGAPEACEIFLRMREFGFEAYEALEGHYRAVDNALAQMDFAFVKRDSILRAEKGYFSAEQARAYAAA